MEDLFSQAEKVLDEAKRKGAIIATAESCTGGMLSTAFTGVPGSSEVFDRGFVTYSNQSKEEMLGITKDLLKKFGAVSENCAEEMAMGAIKRSRASIAIAITGIAGPGGATEDKPVGRIYFACFNKKSNKLKLEAKNFVGDRHNIRVQAIRYALELILSMLDS